MKNGGRVVGLPRTPPVKRVGVGLQSTPALCGVLSPSIGAIRLNHWRIGYRDWRQLARIASRKRHAYGTGICSVDRVVSPTVPARPTFFLKNK